MASHVLRAGQVIAVTVRDVSAPEPLALPRYSGEISIFAAIAMGGVWMFSSAPLIILFGVVYVSAILQLGIRDRAAKSADCQFLTTVARTCIRL